MITIKKNKSSKSIISINNLDIYVSYNTIVGFQSPSLSCRLEDKFSKTTTKHIHSFGIAYFDTLPEKDFNIVLNKEMVDAVTKK